MDAGMDFRLRIATLRWKKHYGYDACYGSKIIKNIVKAQPHLPEFCRMRNSGFNFP